ncbi:MAG: DEAD/DEAH box helicase [Treponema sp.]|nr:DEAD/DEAH box helicase [Treponema sp.]
MKFSEFNLHPDLERGLREAGYVTCMPVQEQVLQNAFGGHDLYVQSQTGTGKTAAFLVVIFQRLLAEAMLNGKKAIIMVPTRELAVQVEEEAKLLGKYLPFKTGSFYGGVGYTQQRKLLRDNAQILVGTPGRVLDLNQSGQMNLMDIAFLVLDEADRMFDMGFYPDLRKLIRVVPPANQRQTMLFSATLNAWVKNLAWEYTKNPFEIAIEPETVTVEEVEQILYHVSSADKMKLLLGILKREEPESALVFCNTKRYAEVVAKRLRLNGYKCEFIMGDLPQTKRLKIIDDIKAGKLNLLVATDVAARGLDIEGLALVVNYDLPNESENYVHRIGRTARAGKTGKAFTLASEQDVYELPRIERYIGRKIPSETATGELLSEDKSEGKRIQTDFREEPDNTKGRPKKRRREHETREPKARRVPPKKEPGHRKQRVSSPRESLSEAKLSALSLEERMAYYRQKYDKSGLSRGKNTGQEKASSKAIAQDTSPRQQAEAPFRQEAGHSGKRRSKAGSRKPDTAAVRDKTQGRESGGRYHKNSRRSPEQAASNSTPNQNTVQENTASETLTKKGILSRLLGIFKKQE